MKCVAGAHSRYRCRHGIRAIMGLQLAALLVLWTAWYIPKSCPLPISAQYVGYYRGLGLADSAGFLGKSYYKVRLPPTDTEDGYTVIRFSVVGYNRFRGTYSTGVLREEGECYVQFAGNGNYVEPDIHNVRNGRYYRPDGTLGSEIVNGTGIQTYWSIDGRKVWEMHVVDFERVRVELGGDAAASQIVRP